MTSPWASAFAREHRCWPVDPYRALTELDRMKRQPVRPELLQDFLLIQDGTIRPHEHVQFFKRSVVLALECAIEDFLVDPQHLISVQPTAAFGYIVFPFRFCFACWHKASS